MGIIRETAKQVPALAIMAVLVFVFLRHLEHRDEFIRQLSETCHSTQRANVATIEKAMDRSTDAIDRNTEALGNVTATLRRLDSGRTN